MRIDAIDVLLAVSYALTQAGVLYILVKAKHIWAFAIQAFVWFILADYFHWGDTTIGFLLSVIIIPVFFISLVLGISCKKISAEYVKIGIAVQFISIIGDVHAKAFAGIFRQTFGFAVYCCFTLIFSLIYAYAIKKILEVVNKRQHIFLSLAKQVPIHTKTLFKYNKLFYLYLADIFVCIVMFVIFFMTLQYYEIRHNMIYVVGIASFLIVFSSSLLAMLIYIKHSEDEHKNELKKNEINSMLKYVSAIEETYERIRYFKHDYKNILLSVSQKNNDQLKNELHKVIEETLSGVNNFDILNALAAIEIMSIKALLSSKIIHLLNQGINIDICVSAPIQKIYMDEFDAIRVLGILLDNAFEEAYETDDKFVQIAALEKDESVIFIIENSCRKQTPSINEMTTKGFSSKGAGRGIGLGSLQEIMNGYANCSYQIGKKSDEVFFAKLIIAKE